MPRRIYLVKPGHRVYFYCKKHLPEGVQVHSSQNTGTCCVCRENRKYNRHEVAHRVPKELRKTITEKVSIRYYDVFDTHIRYKLREEPDESIKFWINIVDAYARRVYGVRVFLDRASSFIKVSDSLIPKLYSDSPVIRLQPI